MRSREVHACLLVLLGVVLALVEPVAAGMEPTFAGDGLVVGHPWSTRLEVENGVAPELTVDLDLHRRVLAGGGIGYPSVQNGDKAACHPGCPAPGRGYTGRGCPNIYGCQN